ncbi:hypothetical protein AMELA_G00240660 [Ameiurus melas]|uniref:Uncharacterized protein n=1 Tax=Ameiurus melas TaxID=219545 RepID=A0A7J5ZVB7_AMEME|nr:hypothetical protein AMELA_G00240660 [Ameiurus melas]
MLLLNPFTFPRQSRGNVTYYGPQASLVTCLWQKDSNTQSEQLYFWTHTSESPVSRVTSQDIISETPNEHTMSDPCTATGWCRSDNRLPLHQQRQDGQRQLGLNSPQNHLHR